MGRLALALMIIRETSDEGEREFELGRENLHRLKELTGLDEATIYTTLNSGKPIEHVKYRWVMIRQ